MAVLVTGGAGYVGSHAVRALQERGQEAVAYDNLSTGYAQALSAPLIVGDILDAEKLAGVMREHNIDAVMHFAAKSVVPESMAHPELYYRNNVAGTAQLLEAMLRVGVDKMIFSSTATVYGIQEASPLTEDLEPRPVSVYARTKLMIEQMLVDFGRAHGIRSIALRYFNVAGAHPSGEIGESHNPETHLIPSVLRHFIERKGPLHMYGRDYPTRDGTCVRDYIAIGDLIRAHLLALEALRAGADSEVYNLGSGTGFSNLEVIACAEAVTGQKADIVWEGRRPGDLAAQVASSERFSRATGWRLEQGGLQEIIASAWKWHSAHPQGFTR